MYMWVGDLLFYCVHRYSCYACGRTAGSSPAETAETCNNNIAGQKIAAILFQYLSSSRFW